MSAGFYLQKAIALRLDGYATTSAYVVSDNIDAEPPFIFIGPGQVARQIRHSSGELYLEEVQVDVYTHNATGSKASKDIAEDVKDALNSSVLDLTGDGWTSLCTPEKIFETTVAELDDAGREVRHTIVRFKFFTSK